MTDIFDTHAHYSSHQFDADREDLMQALPEAVWWGCWNAPHIRAMRRRCWHWPGATPLYMRRWASIPKAWARRMPPLWPSIMGDWRAELAVLRPMLEDPTVVAVGEIGLDHHWPLPAREQYDLFEAQLQLAAELELPVSVHDREAHAETYELLKKYRPRGVLHCYSGSAEDAAWLVAQGMHLGFGGSSTYKGSKRAAKVLAAIPHEAVVLETDCPYMSPEPVRGRRNDSRNIVHVAAHIGELWGMSAQEVLTLTAANARAVFGV